MNKGIWFLSLLLSFSVFAQLQDTGKFELINKVCGSIVGNKNSYSTPVKVAGEDGKKCWRVECRAETRDDKGNLNMTSNYKQRCFSESEIASILWDSGDDGSSVSVSDLSDLGVTVNGNGNGNGGDIRVIVEACKKGNCPDGYSIDANGNVIGPGGSIVWSAGGNSNGGDGDITIGNTEMVIMEMETVE
jgi:hypothetical protein